MNNKGIAQLLLALIILVSTVFGSVGAYAETEEAFTPIVIEHAFGETVIDKKPERIVTIAWENDCTPLALGVAPVGVSEANYGLCTENNLHPWADEAFKALRLGLRSHRRCSARRHPRQLFRTYTGRV